MYGDACVLAVRACASVRACWRLLCVGACVCSWGPLPGFWDPCSKRHDEHEGHGFGVFEFVWYTHHAEKIAEDSTLEVEKALPRMLWKLRKDGGALFHDLGIHDTPGTGRLTRRVAGQPVRPIGYAVYTNAPHDRVAWRTQ